MQLPDVVWALLQRRMGAPQLALERIRLVWRGAVSPFPDDPVRSWPAAFLRRKLVVEVTNSQWLHELRYHEANIRERLHQLCPDVEIDEFRFVIARGDFDLGPPLETSPSPTERLEPPLEADPPRETMAALLKVQDPTLRDLLASTRLVLGQRHPLKK
ncbi:MAG: DciA family protein [Nannocystaceae bacterium]